MKKLMKVLLCIACLSILVGCGMEKLSDKYNEDELRQASEAIIKQLSSGKYNEIIANGGSTLQGEGTEDTLKKGHESVSEKSGNFKGIDNMIFQEKNGYACVVTIAKYEKKKIQYIFSFDEE